jgi:hypothetical protein
MHILRGPKESIKWTTTDSKEPPDYIENWGKYGCIHFDGTITKGAERHTTISVHLEEKDVLALAIALMNNEKLWDKVDSADLLTLEKELMKQIGEHVAKLEQDNKFLLAHLRP